MQAQKIYINEKSEITIICSSCGKMKTTEASRYKDHSKPIKVQCLCGFEFHITLENRKNYRKEVDIFGEYTVIDPPKGSGEMRVKNLSRTGLALETYLDHDMSADDIVKVRFVLDDGKNSVILKNVLVKHVRGRSVGAQFCDDDHGKTLAFYLMP